MTVTNYDAGNTSGDEGDAAADNKIAHDDTCDDDDTCEDHDGDDGNDGDDDDYYLLWVCWH